MHSESTKLWWARNGDPELHTDKYLAKLILKTKNTDDLHSEHNKPLNPVELGSGSGNRPRETYGNMFIMREMHAYSVSGRILTSLELPQINKVIENK